MILYKKLFLNKNRPCRPNFGDILEATAGKIKIVLPAFPTALDWEIPF